MIAKLSFENLGTNTYLVYEVKSEDELDTMSLGMLTNNSIPGFAPVSFTQMDMTKYVKYNVSAKVSVNQLFSGPVNKKRLIGVFSGVVDAMLSAEEYMLDPSSILLNMDYIFADVSTCETEMVCLPLLNLQNENQDLAMFFKNILFTTQFDQTENCDHVAQLINYLNTHPVLLLEEFKQLLHTLSHGPAAPAPVASVQQPVQPAPQPAAQAPAQPAPQPAPVQPAPQPMTQAPVQPAPRPAPAQPVTQRPVQPVQKKPNPAPVMQVPEAPAPKNAPAAPAPKNGEKPMTLMYLMQHYNKENAAIYKAQQDAKKAKSATPAPQPAKPAPKQPAPPANAGFAVPGKQPGFAIPGQAQPVPQPAPQPAAQAPAQPAPRPAPQPVPQPAPQTVAQAPVQPVQQAPVSAPLNFGETTVLSAGVGETTVLSAVTETTQTNPHLIRTKNNERIPLNKPVFRIGKERSYVDYFIGDNTAISRSHANIVNHNGEFFVVDTNSTNHTYVNGGMIQSGVETKLSHGTKIRLANEDFEFKLY